MTVEWTNIEVPLGAGLDTKTNQKLLKPPAAVDLVDAIFPASGVAGYETRPGYGAVSTETTVSTIRSAVVRDNELAVLSDSNLYSVSELANNVDLVDRGSLYSIRVDQATLDTQATNQEDGQVIEYQGIRVHAWHDSEAGNVRYTVTDIGSESVVVQNVELSNSQKPKLAKCGNAILIIYYNDSAGSYRCEVIPVAAPGTPSNTELVTDPIDNVFDCCEVDSSLQSVYVVYNREFQESSRLTGFQVDESGGSSDVTEIDTVGADCVAAATDFYRFVVAYSDSTNIYTAWSSNGNLNIQNSYSTSSTARANCENIALVTRKTEGAGRAQEWNYVFCEFSATGSAPFNTDQFRYVEISAKKDISAVGTGFASPTSTIQQSSIASSAFLHDNDGWVNICFDAPTQPTYFLINSAAEIQAKCCSGVAQGAVRPHLPRVVDYTWCATFRERLPLDLDLDEQATDTGAFSQLGLKRVYYDFSYKPSSVQYGRASYIASGILWAYDGYTRHEQGFLVYPETLDDTVSNGTGLLSNNVDYAYRVYYEWINARGERQRSTTAQIYRVSMGASDDTVQLEIPTLAHTYKGAGVSIVIYRTQSNPNVLGGSPFYRVSSADPAATGNNGYLANDPTAATVTFTDGIADTDLVKRELDYLNSGELENVAPVESHVIGESKRRVWMAGSERENRVYYSKTNARGRDQLEFTDTNWVEVPEEDGAVTAIGALNFHTVLFKENSIYAVSGEGRNNVGAGFFNIPQIVSLDVGCVDQRSVVNIPAGIVFKSNKGFWLVGHNLDTQYIGANVEAYNNQNVTAATIVPDRNHVIFLTSSGSSLCYNYLVNAWSRFTNHAGNDSCLWNGTYTYMRTNGRIYRENTSYTDDGVHYAMKFVTAPIGIKGVQGFQRVRSVQLLGEYYSPHTLRVGVRYDHEPGVIDSGTWDPRTSVNIAKYGDGAYGDGEYGGGGSPVYQAKFKLPRQKCQVVQFEIDTTNTENAGRAVSIQALQIEVGAKRGTGELSVDRTFSGTGGSTV